jgi:anion-transporting  ArsA/GET3 family ATPase
MGAAPLIERNLIFVTGKGGVGKTTVAAGLAQMLADQGRTVLGCEIDAKGDLSAAFEVPPSGFVPQRVSDGLSLMAMDTEASLREYLKLHLRIPIVGRIGPVAKAFDFLATAAPGVKEILTIGKVCWEVRERHYDTVVVDAPATGHIVSQLSAPQVINDLVKVGLIRSQTDWMSEILGDPDQTGLVIVTTPEEMPVSETLELVAAVEEKTDVDIATVVVNRLLPERFSPRDEAVFDKLGSKKGRAILDEELGGGSVPLLEAARLATVLRRSRTQHLDTLRRGLPAGLPLILVPELFSRTDGLRATRQVAVHLGEELL